MNAISVVHPRAPMAENTDTPAIPSRREHGQALDLATLARGYAAGTWTPRDIVNVVRQRIAARPGDGVWLSTVGADALGEAARIQEERRRGGERLPLFGVPFAVKDNIDVAGLPTTAACPAFAYTPAKSARAVARLIDAGAIVIGKTNLDQFATGLVGVRSPTGFPRNPFNDAVVPGGSSSGSAVAVALGQVSFALGTDTAGSGRIPAAFNNIVGLKPSRGVLSAAGVVPACRSLDCVSVFAATCEDAARVASVARGFDASDPFSRTDADSVHFDPGPCPAAFSFGVPRSHQRRFHGDTLAAQAFDKAIAGFVSMGGTPVDVDLTPFLEAGALLYDGPFVVERLEAAGELLARDPAALLPPLRAILTGAARHQARDVFAAQTRLQALRRQVGSGWTGIDFLLLPTAPTLPTVAAVLSDPIGVNASLGLYTTFANLLDLAALAVPAGFRSDGLPAGVTLLGPWGTDGHLATFGAAFHRRAATHIGATEWPLPPTPSTTARTTATATDASTVTATVTATVATTVTTTATTTATDIPIAVVGAHLAGEPLNHQLTSSGGRLLRAAKTAARYRLFALAGTVPPKPGLLRAGENSGTAIDIEIWALSPEAFAAFVARIPAPLCVGKIQVDDGTEVSGFLCESHATNGARDISTYGGWRAFLRAISDGEPTTTMKPE